MEGKEILLYTCDPTKNIICSKKSCAHNTNAVNRWCDKTANIKYSTDGVIVDRYWQPHNHKEKGIPFEKR